MKWKRIISLFLAVISLVCLLCGCTSSVVSKGVIKFRDVPFGTGRVTAEKTVLDGLKEQGYYTNKNNTDKGASKTYCFIEYMSQFYQPIYITIR